MRFFCDNCIPVKIAKALTILAAPAVHVMHLTDEFDPDTKDHDWIPTLTKGQDCIVSGDYHITKNKHEKQLLESAGVTTFVFRKGWMDVAFWKVAHKIVRVFPDIIELSKKHPEGKVFQIDRQFHIKE